MTTTVDLSTRYLGFPLANPIVPSASPLTGDIDSLHRLVEAGAPAVVLPSLFEEQVEHDALAMHLGLEFGAGSHAEAAGGYLPELAEYNTGPDEYLQLMGTARSELGIPVIASLNGASPGGWTRYARILEDAGASAIELNLYFLATDPDETSQAVESRCLRLVEDVRSVVRIPLAVKIGPFFSSMPAMARGFAAAGAEALVLFNRFYQPDIELETLSVIPSLRLSTADELRLPLRWIAVLRDVTALDLAATTGVHSAAEVVKVLLAGANVAMMASALLHRGPVALTEAVEGLGRWLADHGYQSAAQAQGSLSRSSSPDPGEYERANYMQVLTHYSSDWRRRTLTQ